MTDFDRPTQKCKTCQDDEKCPSCPVDDDEVEVIEDEVEVSDDDDLLMYEDDVEIEDDISGGLADIATVLRRRAPGPRALWSDRVHRPARHRTPIDHDEQDPRKNVSEDVIKFYLKD